MARKKEPELESRNKERIAQIAKTLFLEKGVENTTMNDIAKTAEMSKSTLYVYFKSKEDVKNYLSLEAMEYLLESLKENVSSWESPRERFMAVCDVLVVFKKQYPLNFQLLVEKICIEEQALKEDEVLRKIYETGEKVNGVLLQTIGCSICATEEVEQFLQIFSMWGKLYGVITLADEKEEYIKMAAGITKEAFLQRNFEELYQSIEWREN